MKKVLLSFVIALMLILASCKFNERDDEAEETSIRFVTMPPVITESTDTSQDVTSTNAEDTQEKILYETAAINPTFEYSEYIVSYPSAVSESKRLGIDLDADEIVRKELVIRDHLLDKYINAFNTKNYSYCITHMPTNDESLFCEGTVFSAQRFDDNLTIFNSFIAEEKSGKVSSICSYDMKLKDKMYSRFQFAEAAKDITQAYSYIHYDALPFLPEVKFIRAYEAEINKKKYVCEVWNYIEKSGFPANVYAYFEGERWIACKIFNKNYGKKIYIVEFSDRVDDSLFVEPKNVAVE